MTLAVGVDVGGTKVVAGVVTDAGEIITVKRYSTPDNDAPHTVAMIAQAVNELSREYAVTAVGIGAAGWIDATSSIVEHAPNLGWRKLPLRAMVAEKINVPVIVENDANAAAWAEYRFGAGQGATNEVAITLGTGLGGGVVLAGQVYRGAFGQAGEFGHVQMVRDGELCGCGGRGCWEQYASGSALTRFARVRATADPAGASRLLELAGETTAIAGPHITEAAANGDPVARAAFADVAGWLGIGLADIVATWDPDRIVLGGGLAETGDLLLEPTTVAYERTLAQRGRTDPYAQLVLATLGNKAGLVGAADLARR